MDTETIQQRVASFPRWHYEFDLQGVKTPVAFESYRNRHRQRAAYFFPPLVDLCGGTLRGKRVLDLACNAGFWSLEAIKAGADFVHGVDGEPTFIDQANFVFEASNIEPERYKFSVGNVITDDLSELGSFDIVLCLGLLYHIATPIELFENVSKASSDILLIDTGVSTRSGNVVELRREILDDPRDNVNYELVMFPTRRAVLDMVGLFGYQAVPLRPHISDYEGMIDYLTGNRLAFVAAKVTDLSRLPSARIGPLFAAPEALGRRAVLAVRAAASASSQLARPGVHRRGQVVRGLFGAYRRQAKRISDPL